MTYYDFFSTIKEKNKNKKKNEMIRDKVRIENAQIRIIK